MQPYIHYPIWMARELGSSAAIILSRLIYWEPKARTEIDGDRWIYKTLEEWAAETSLSISTVRRALDDLLNLGLIEKAKLQAKKWRQICFYKINHNVLENLQGSICSKRTNGVSQSEQLDLANLHNSSIDPKETNKNHSQSRLASESERKLGMEEINLERTGYEQTALNTSNISSQDPKNNLDSNDPNSIDEKYSSPPNLSSKINKVDQPLLMWLMSRAKRLGKHDPLSWAYVVAQSPSQVLLEEFKAHQDNSFEVTRNDPVEPIQACPPPPGEGVTQLATADQLARLVAKWKIEAPGLQYRFRESVKQEIAAHPELGLICDPETGPQLVAEDPAQPDLEHTTPLPNCASAEILTELPMPQQTNSSMAGAELPILSDGCSLTSFSNYFSLENNIADSVEPDPQERFDDDDFFVEDLGDILAEVTNFFNYLQWGKAQVVEWLLTKFGQRELSRLTDPQLLQVHRALLVEVIG